MVTFFRETDYAPAEAKAQWTKTVRELVLMITWKWKIGKTSKLRDITKDT